MLDRIAIDWQVERLHSLSEGWCFQFVAHAQGTRRLISQDTGQRIHEIEQGWNTGEQNNDGKTRTTWTGEDRRHMTRQHAGQD